MKKYFNLFVIVLCLSLFACSEDNDSGNNGGGGGGIVAQATYRITFMPNFTAETHPTDYPDNAMFSKIFLVAHGASTDIFSLGSLASPGLKLYVEEGDSSTLLSEHTGGEDDDAATIIVGTSDVGPTTSVFFDILVTPTTTKISFISKISPSPDWFVGIDAFELANPDDTLIEEAELRLFPLDGGTDSGTTYESPNEPEPAPMTQIEGLPFNDGGGTLTTILGILKIERLN